MNKTMPAAHPLLELKRASSHRSRFGVCSVCSAHPWVIDATLKKSLDESQIALIEATCNQVNQEGGYTGMTPADFARFVRERAEKMGFPADRLILGGDHLGPYPWRTGNAREALERACVMTRDYARAGFAKIHLDASMRLADDPGSRSEPLDPFRVAARAARLCEAAEEGWRELRQEYPDAVAPVYVIGTEVPIPGGVSGAEGPPAVTAVADFEEGVETAHAAFKMRGLNDAWTRVAAVVVQPGVEFGDQEVHRYDREKSRALSRALNEYPNLVFEGHSTDYQSAEDLRRMVEDGIAILKVGPALTFAMRDALFALEAIEQDWLAETPEAGLSRLSVVMERTMLADPRYWQDYYHGSANEMRLARRYSLSDRIRYYWNRPEARTAVQQLIDNLRRSPAPLALVSRHFPIQHEKIRRGLLENEPEAIILDRIGEALDPYYQAIRGD